MPNSNRPRTRVERSRAGNVATLLFSTEGGINVFSSSVLGELGEHLNQIAEDAHIRFVVLRGEGRIFLAGANIEEMAQFDQSRGEALSNHGHHVFDLLEALPQVTIAAINGHALGGGCELAIACDFRIAVASAQIGQPESRLGLIPGWGGTQRLPRLVGLSRARRMMFSGESISADEARAIGLVDEVVPTVEDLDAAMRRWFVALTPGSPAAVKRIKRALRSGDETDQFSLCFSCSDAKEGIAAFLEKRAPLWAAPPP
ncbi:MAG: enoyl-CoA hydratase/isomerase family protein [Phycisphaerae bacterium]